MSGYRAKYNARGVDCVMGWQLVPFGVVSVIFGLVGLFLPFFLLRKRSEQLGAKELALFCFLASIWTLTSGIYILNTQYAIKLFWWRVGVLGFSFAPLSFWVFYARYLQREHWLRWRWLLGLAVLPMLMLTIRLNNQIIPSLSEAYQLISQNGFIQLQFSLSPVGYLLELQTVIIYFVGAALFLPWLNQEQRRWQAIVMILIPLFRLMADVIWLTRWYQWNLLPITTLVVAGLLVWHFMGANGRYSSPSHMQIS